MRRTLMLVLAVAVLGVLPAGATASTWDVGDVFAAIGFGSAGSYNVYDNNGNFKETITDPSGDGTTGCAFRPGPLGDLYTTDFGFSQVVKYSNVHPHPITGRIDTTPPGGADNESIVFDGSGNFYIGNADGDRDVQKYNVADAFVMDFDVETENRGSDWIDLARDQHTLFYTSEGHRVLRYDLATSTQLPDFASGLPGVAAYALRLLPPGDGSGGLLVADTEMVHRLDGAGNIVQSYDVAGEDSWFALNLDPNGTSFWSGDFGTDNFYRFNIATGAVEVGPISAGSGFTLFGLCLKGEVTAGVEGPPGSPSCSDNIDNDNDGKIDEEDEGCQEIVPPERTAQHFRAYRATGGAATLERMTLVDQFGSAVVRLGPARVLMTPVQKARTGRDPEPIQRPAEHLKCYRIAGTEANRTVTISNQFRESTVVTAGKPTDLCAPASKSLEGDPGAPPADVNHYKCYEVSRTPSVAENVQLTDQFGSEQVRVQRLSRLCNPVEKRRTGRPAEPPPHPAEHLACYQIREPAGFNAVSVFTQDQFRSEVLELTKPSRLCVPSTKTEGGGV
jgi:hypothetical protein